MIRSFNLLVGLVFLPFMAALAAPEPATLRPIVPPSESTDADMPTVVRVRSLVRSGQFAACEDLLADPKRLAGLVPADGESSIAGELFALAQEARNDGRFADMVELSRRAVARLEKAERATAATDLDRQVAHAEFKTQIAEIYGPSPDFRAQAYVDLAEKRAARSQRKSARQEGVR